MKRYLLIALLTLAGCGKGVIVASAERTAEFDTAFDVFREEAMKRGVWSPAFESIAIRFGSPPDRLTASCIKPALGARHIVVNEAEWRRFAAGTQILLILHELGHCALNREHVPPGTLSIMSQPLPDRLELEIHFNDLMDELLLGQ
jgi:hypothetical protein